jgi:GDP-4-dehydro-6-deoxy-D-mannose reductase
VSILVTGAAGFAGRHLLARLVGSADVVGWHRPDSAAAAMAGVRWRAVELLDRESVRVALGADRPEAIYHLAGIAHVGDSWAYAEETLAGNVIATAHLFQGLRELGWRPRVLITGSATIYKASDTPLTEDSALAPNTPYGTSKLAQEMLALAAWREDGLPAIVTRSFNHIGAGQSPAFAAASFARQLATIEAGLAPPVINVGNLTAARDVTDVRDTVRAYEALMAQGRPGVAYNVCSGRVDAGDPRRVARTHSDAGRGGGGPGADAPGRHAGDCRQSPPPYPRHQLDARDWPRRHPRRADRLLARRGRRRTITMRAAALATT